MTPQEKTLIEGVFDRLAQTGVGTKDTQADLLIRERVRAQPDATYGLVQAVVMLEAGLNQAQTQIDDLRNQLSASRSSPAATGFLPNAGPWAAAAGQRPAAAMANAAAPSQTFAPPPMVPPVAGPWTQAASPTGGFLRNAATMAAGVAGGTLIAEGLSSLFGGRGYGGGFGGPFGGGFGGGGFGGGGGVENVTVNNYYEDAALPTQDASYQDTAYQDAAYDDSAASDDGGFDDGGSFDDGSI